MKVSLLTGGNDPPYALPLTKILTSKGIFVDFIGNDEMQTSEIMNNSNVCYYNLRGNQDENAPLIKKIKRILLYYLKLFKYAATTDSKIFHIQWLNRFDFFDRTLLNIYYKSLGKKIAFTAHNINSGVRDEKDSLLNRLSLKCMYRMVDHVFVHTNKMKSQLINEFNIRDNKITVIPFGINNTVPNTELLPVQAKERLGFETDQKIILYFGLIAPYKGLEHLVLSLNSLKKKYPNLKLIIAGKINAGQQHYWETIRNIIKSCDLEQFIVQRIEYVPDEEVEIYFKAADVLVLPYKFIFQSGPLFLAYNFGLPVIATDVGSFREDIIEGKTGFICRPENPEDLADKIDLYFNSDLYKNLENMKKEIIDYAHNKYSWEKVGEQSCAVYKTLSKNPVIASG